MACQVWNKRSGHVPCIWARKEPPFLGKGSSLFPRISSQSNVAGTIDSLLLSMPTVFKFPPESPWRRTPTAMEHSLAIEKPKLIYHRLSGVEFITAFEVSDWIDKHLKCLLLKDLGVIISIICTAWTFWSSRTYKTHSKHSRGSYRRLHKTSTRIQSCDMKLAIVCQSATATSMLFLTLISIIFDSAATAAVRSKNPSKHEVSSQARNWYHSCVVTTSSINFTYSNIERRAECHRYLASKFAYGM